MRPNEEMRSDFRQRVVLEGVPNVDAAGCFMLREETQLRLRAVAVRDALLRRHEQSREVLVALGEQVVVDLARRQRGDQLKSKVTSELGKQHTFVKFLRCTKE